jgi:hypothetical protein
MGYLCGACRGIYGVCKGYVRGTCGIPKRYLMGTYVVPRLKKEWRMINPQ